MPLSHGLKQCRCVVLNGSTFDRNTYYEAHKFELTHIHTHTLTRFDTRTSCTNKTLTFTEPVQSNGIYFQRKSARNAEMRELEPTTFLVWGSNDGEKYDLVATSGQCGWLLDSCLRQLHRARESTGSSLPRSVLPLQVQPGADDETVLHLDYTRPACQWPRLLHTLSAWFLAMGMLWAGAAPCILKLKAKCGVLVAFIIADVCRLASLSAAWHPDLAGEGESQRQSVSLSLPLSLSLLLLLPLRLSLSDRHRLIQQ